MSANDGGGRRAVFRRSVSNEVVGEFTEPFVGATSEYTVVLADYSEMTAEDFERTWLKR